MSKRNRDMIEDLLKKSHRNLCNKASSNNIRRKECYEIMSHVKLNKETMKMILNGLDDAGLVKKRKHVVTIFGKNTRGRHLNIDI